MMTETIPKCSAYLLNNPFGSPLMFDFESWWWQWQRMRAYCILRNAWTWVGSWHFPKSSGFWLLEWFSSTLPCCDRLAWWYIYICVFLMYLSMLSMYYICSWSWKLLGDPRWSRPLNSRMCHSGAAAAGKEGEVHGGFVRLLALLATNISCTLPGANGKELVGYRSIQSRTIIGSDLELPLGFDQHILV